ncbi:MAG: 2-oxo acid dehydrogenase subunit E2 [Bacteroidia bacterium]|nr:2-oxo acid dehydrogenase subunit E2 [Bacteroidia bacterium]MCZ2247699.1 2-oxo acid dehydrogenase subunit E2 [Bacteroidia bacterium]
MPQYEMIMPKMGESVAEATITKWLKNEGDNIAADESVLEIATDKVDSEVPAQKGGVLIKRLFNEGDVVQVGSVIAVIADSAAETVTSTVAPAAVAPQAQSQAESKTENHVTVKSPVVNSGDRFYSPLVRSIAKEENISMAELDTIQGTGKDGRVTKEDILSYIAGNKHIPTPSSAPIQPAPTTIEVSPTTVPPSATTTAKTEATPSVKPAISLNAGDEIIEMDRMRKLISEHMVRSKHTSPHVTSFVEADVTNIVMWRNKIKNSFEKRENEKITFTPIFIEAVARAIKDFPMINVSVDGSNIIKRKDINIGMATALPSGNLIVPVIKNADQRNLLGLTKSVNDLANRARIGKLNPDEISGGTFTLTNVGSFGNVMGTPIINQPQVAIMAVGTIKKKPVVIETPWGDTIGIRHMMFLSLSYDHRVVDGSLGGSFVRRVADYLENFDTNTIV